MRISLNILREFVDLKDIPDSAILDTLPKAGLEVEAVQPLAGTVSGVFSGKIVAIERHPDADKLSLLRVDVGGGNGQQTGIQNIVCGAANFKMGDVVPVALIGAQIPGIKIKKSKIRGIESQGMCCSEKELGIAEQAPGLLILEADTLPGRPIQDLVDLNDTLIEINVTPNRGDCLSYRGVARELSAHFQRSLLPSKFFHSLEPLRHHGHTFQLEVETPDCPRYGGLYVPGVNVGPSPLWLQTLLLKSGFRPVNNLVDITNFVLIAHGHPMHAFDADKLVPPITIRKAREGERVTTLDGKPRSLRIQDTLIADANGVIAIAGVMGGGGCEVTTETKAVFFEAAVFSPASVRKTSRYLGLGSESSYRFERGVDPQAVGDGLAIALGMVEKLIPGKGFVSHAQLFDKYGAARELSAPYPRVISFTVDKFNRHLGTGLTDTEIGDYLRRLGFNIEGDGIKHPFVCHVPSYRNDIEREADLWEEVAKLQGYDNIPFTIPQLSNNVLHEDQKGAHLHGIREFCAALGLNETVNYSFLPRTVERGGLFAIDRLVPVVNPLSEEMVFLRDFLVYNLVNNVRLNLSRGQKNLGLFEIGTVFRRAADGGVEERTALGIALFGQPAFNWTRTTPFDLPDLVGLFSGLDRKMGWNCNLDVGGADWFIEGQGSRIIDSRGTGCGIIGLLDGRPVFEVPGKGKLFYLEIELDGLMEEGAVSRFRPLSPFPSLDVDLSVVLARAVPAARVLEAIRSVGGPLLENVAIYDLYQGNKVGEDERSFNISLCFRHGEKTLSDAEVHPIFDKIIAHLREKLNARLRDS